MPPNPIRDLYALEKLNQGRQAPKVHYSASLARGASVQSRRRRAFVK